MLRCYSTDFALERLRSSPHLFCKRHDQDAACMNVKFPCCIKTTVLPLAQMTSNPATAAAGSGLTVMRLRDSTSARTIQFGRECSATFRLGRSNVRFSLKDLVAGQCLGLGVLAKLRWEQSTTCTHRYKWAEQLSPTRISVYRVARHLVPHRSSMIRGTALCPSRRCKGLSLQPGKAR